MISVTPDIVITVVLTGNFEGSITLSSALGTIVELAPFFKGATGAGVPSGGTNTQIIQKVGTVDFVTAWTTPIWEIADVDILKADTADTLTAGFSHTPYDIGTVSSGSHVVDMNNGNVQKMVNGGAHTISPPIGDGAVAVKVTNNASAGIILTPAFTLVDGDSLTVTDGDVFLLSILNIDGSSSLTVKALQ